MRGFSALMRHSMAWPEEGDVLLLERERGAGGDADLLEHEVDTGNRLGHRMLHLQPRVHLDEIELAVLVEELHRAGAAVLDLAHGRRHRLADFLACGVVERRRGGLLEDLLMAPLQGAVALAEMDRIALTVAENLDLDVARLGEIFLHVDLVVAEGGLGFGARRRQGHAEVGGRCGRPSCRDRRRRRSP